MRSLPRELTIREINTIVENEGDDLSNQDDRLDPDNGNPND
jgi:hypothetical protein